MAILKNSEGFYSEIMSSLRLFSWKLMIQATETSPLSSSSSSTSLHFSPPCGLVLFGQTSERIRMKWIPKRPTHTHTRTDSVNFLVFSLLAFWLCYLTPFSGSTRVADTKGTHAAKKVPHTQHLRPTFFFFASIGCLWAFHWPPLISILFTK